ncbi:hypothetical protein F4777DRAFT_567898 [Nemania sp. FL0916]|nr:hypothetical protein F4777DRAFT_567898 [Nemania sp. FL0916]
MAASVRLGETPKAPIQRTDASKTRPLISFETPKASPWVVPLPAGAVRKLLLGFQPSSMDDRYFVYTDGPNSDGEIVVHVHRSWTGLAVADVTIKVSCGADGKPDIDGDGSRITRIVYDASQTTWDNEMLGLANLDTAKGFAMHVLGDWVFGIRFSKPIWNDVDARFRNATKDYMRYLEALEEEEESRNA